MKLPGLRLAKSSKKLSVTQVLMEAKGEGGLGELAGKNEKSVGEGANARWKSQKRHRGTKKEPGLVKAGSDCIRRSE